MSQLTCRSCSRTLSTREAYELNGEIYCATCAQTAAQRAKDAGERSGITRYVDKSVCGRCNTYIGEGGVAAGPLRLCLPCSELLQNWPYPQWLKFSLAVLLLLLVFALVHGRKYFEAGKDLYRGERLVEQGQYREALLYLKRTVKLAPKSDKAVLLAAKAAILSGDLQTASQALEGHNNGYFEDADQPEVREVSSLWDNATAAVSKLEQAEKLEEQDGHEVEAARLAHDAAAMYPQLPGLTILVHQYDEGVAFSHKDYDAFLAIAQRDWDSLSSAHTAANLSSALACKYAVTGERVYRQRSEEMLAKARQLAEGDKESLSDLAEYEPRIRYRLETRQIITKTEYDKKFRSGANAAK